MVPSVQHPTNFIVPNCFLLSSHQKKQGQTSIQFNLNRDTPSLYSNRDTPRFIHHKKNRDTPPINISRSVPNYDILIINLIKSRSVPHFNLFIQLQSGTHPPCIQIGTHLFLFITKKQGHTSHKHFKVCPPFQLSYSTSIRDTPQFNLNGDRPQSN